jgi:predicted transcriptional regulator
MNRLFIVLFCAIVGLSPLCATDVTASWENMYHQSRSDEQRLAVLKEIFAIPGQDWAPLATEAIEEIYAKRIETPDPNATTIRVAIARLLIKECVALHQKDETRTIIGIYRDVHDPLLKADAALALAQFHATEYADLLARDLSDLNLQPEQGRSAAMEAQAYGLVQALEQMHTPSGFAPVFMASIAWYSHASQVRQIAKSALATMVADPSLQLKTIVETDNDPAHKLAALDAAMASQAPDANKAEVARAALAQGLGVYLDKLQGLNALAALRMAATKALVDTKDKSPASVSFFRNCIELKGATNDELLAVYTALGANASPDAVKLLADRMADYNLRQKSGLNTPNDRKLIMQIIASLKAAKDPAGKTVLVEAQFVNHDGTVARAAKDAADSLN